MGANYFTLCLIDNFGCSRSIDNEIEFHCFVENCAFETANLGDLLEHLDVHKGKWLGFCHACNVQVHDKQVPLLKELQHWDRCHRLDKNGIYILFQADNRQSKLQEAVKNARVQRVASGEEFDDQFNIVSLKPWTNPKLTTQDKCSKVMNKTRLYSLFKCMGRNCAFSTSCDKSMLTHLDDHRKSATTADLSWLECAYCDVINNSHSSLVQHILQTHASSSYQCQYCFYRSCTACNVAFHLKTFHDCRVKSVLVCCGRKLHPVERTVVEENRSMNVPPLRCSEVCNEITYRMDEFVHHLKHSTAHHDNKFKCQFCGSDILISEATQHLLSHKIGVYQCIYCRYGANDIPNIHNHTVREHPNRSPLICVRLTKKNRVLSEKELTSVGSPLISHLSQTVDSKWLKICPVTDEEWSNDSVVRTAIITEPCTPFAAGEDSNDPLFNGQDDFLSYDDLKDDYASDDWNEYFEVNRLLQQQNVEDSIDHNSFDEGFADQTCNNTTISQMDRTEPLNLGPEVVVNNEVLFDKKPTKFLDLRRDSAFTTSDDDDSKLNCSIELRKRGKKVEKKSTTETFTKPSEPKLSDIFRYLCAYCPKSFTDLQSVHEHWNKQHAKPNAIFMFRITRAFQCCYCRHLNTFDDLKLHCERKHSNETFAMIDNINPKNCALCASQFCNASTEMITDHFRNYHNFAGMNNSIRLESYLTDKWLEKIVAKQIPQATDPVNQIMYDCSHCLSFRCRDQSAMVAHIRNHFLRYRCSLCDKTFEKVNLLEKHLAIAHPKQNATGAVSTNENLSNYLEMRIIFPGGLVLTNRECVNTRFGAMDELVRMVKEMNGHDEQLSIRTQDGQLSQPLPKSKISTKISQMPKTNFVRDDSKTRRGRPKVVKGKNGSPSASTGAQHSQPSEIPAKRARFPRLPKTNGASDDGVDCERRRGRPKVVKGKKDSPPKTSADGQLSQQPEILAKRSPSQQNGASDGAVDCETRRGRSKVVKGKNYSPPKASAGGQLSQPSEIPAKRGRSPRLPKTNGASVNGVDCTRRSGRLKVVNGKNYSPTKTSAVGKMCNRN